MKRVVITGYGLVSPIGNSVSQSWINVQKGVSGVQRYLNDPILKNEKPYNLSLVKNDFDFKKWRVPHADNRMNNFLHCATDEALTHSKIDLETLDKSRAGICIGNMASSNTKLLDHIHDSRDKNYQNINRLSMLQVLTNIPCASLNVKYKFKGPSLTVSTACATGLSAVVQAYKWIKYGEVDLVIAGSTQDVYNSLYLYSSLRLQAMSSKQYEKAEHSSCPFDKSRSGFILGEGSGVLVLQNLEHAHKRNAEIKSEVLGYGCTSDGYSLVRPQGSGQSQINAMKLALKMAKLESSSIDQLSTHATSTLAGDEIQARSIRELFGNKTLVTAMKSYLGHTFGSAGSIQLILGLESMHKNTIPKILNLSDPDVDGVNYAMKTEHFDQNYLLKNSFGFGGINVSAAFKKGL